MSHNLNEDWSSFFEIYGNEKAGIKKNYVDGGGAYLMYPDLQLDLSVGWGRNHGIEEKYASFGFSWRNKLF